MAWTEQNRMAFKVSADGHGCIGAICYRQYRAVRVKRLRNARVRRPAMLKEQFTLIFEGKEERHA